MPNYCWNYVEFKSDNKTHLKSLQSKLTYAKDYDYFSDFCLWVLSKQTRKNPKVDGFDEAMSLYDYAYQFGTKWWDIHENTIDGDTLVVSGDSAWGPPQPFIEEICKTYNMTAHMTYEEPGADFGGEAWYNEHGEVEDRCYEYQQWRYMNCENLREYFDEELWCSFEDEDLEEFRYSLNEHYKWLTKADRIQFEKWFVEAQKQQAIRTSEE